jgi:hypothetical protein
MRKLFPIILFFLFVSCHKEFIGTNTDYVGDWNGGNHPYYFIRIDSKSNFIYHRRSDGDDYIEGKAKLSKDYIHIGIHRFKIIAAPTKIDSVHWKMTLKSPTFYGGYTVTYYKE